AADGGAARRAAPAVRNGPSTDPGTDRHPPQYGRQPDRGGLPPARAADRPPPRAGTAGRRQRIPEAGSTAHPRVRNRSGSTAAGTRAVRRRPDVRPSDGAARAFEPLEPGAAVDCPRLGGRGRTQPRTVRSMERSEPARVGAADEDPAGNSY